MCGPLVLLSVHRPRGGLMPTLVRDAQSWAILPEARSDGRHRKKAEAKLLYADQRGWCRETARQEPDDGPCHQQREGDRGEPRRSPKPREPDGDNQSNAMGNVGRQAPGGLAAGQAQPCADVDNCRDSLEHQEEPEEERWPDGEAATFPAPLVG